MAFPPDDVRAVPCDLAVPELLCGAPGPGRRAREQLASWAGTEVYHVLHLPADWRSEARLPVIVEYAGNGGYENPRYGDRCTGTPEGCRLGYGLAAGRGFLWLCLPFVNAARTANETRWWGDAEATAEYAIAAVEHVCARYGGDPERVLLAGFSRGAIACNYIGLRHERIARLWRAFVAHSHYDGVRRWGYAGDDRAAALDRLQRLRGRPQFISHERTVDPVRAWLDESGVRGDFTLLALPYGNHTDDWTLRPVPERALLRRWVRRALDLPAGAVREGGD